MKLEKLELEENKENIIAILNTQQQELFSDVVQANERLFSIGAFENDEWRGGAIAKLYGNTMHLSLLGINIECRHQGVGTALMKKIEQLSIENKCLYLTVNTQDYQAREFYEHFGFEVFGSIKDTPFIGTTKYYLKKKL
ncbi:GNAT family N-acetyltransferase [Lactobacillus sp. YT155]|uniref:GNAT family N-acetyltransferase n=1 Tax=Lactobacillus sp. YT155 TaxID=3060955 RepID=UPI0026602781|nr:GNAT family N-acetyltransferase [Lactobacillus sp. YT155]MDO1605047.1 GNAT family N-acetyltransferase [Lactobacillus sp. YT155]